MWELTVSTVVTRLCEHFGVPAKWLYILDIGYVESRLCLNPWDFSDRKKSRYSQKTGAVNRRARARAVQSADYKSGGSAGAVGGARRARRTRRQHGGNQAAEPKAASLALEKCVSCRRGVDVRSLPEW